MCEAGFHPLHKLCCVHTYNASTTEVEAGASEVQVVLHI